MHPQDQWLGPGVVELAAAQRDEIDLGVHSALHPLRRERELDGVAKSVVQRGEQLIDR